MEHFILLIVSVCVSVWFFYKYKESQNRLKTTISKNLSLKLENNSMKTKIKYLETYKNDVSKTFKILDDELLLIKDNLTQNPQQQTQTRQPEPSQQTNQEINQQTNPRIVPRHRVSLLTPSVLTSLMTNETQAQPSQDVFNNIFNRFLTSNITNNDIELLRQQESLIREPPQVIFNQSTESQTEVQKETTREETSRQVQTEVPKETTRQETPREVQTEVIRTQLESIKEEDETNILYSPNNYSKYLIN